MKPAVAAGHPATAAAGAEILAEGGNAADAAVAAALASCVAETVMTGLLGGAHAIHFDARTGRVENLDCFVTVPSGSGAPMTELAVPFGEEVVHYAIGASSCGVPGLPAGLDALWRTHGQAALAASRRAGAAACAHRRPDASGPRRRASSMLEPVMTMREGADIYAPGGALLAPGDLLRQPGLVHTLELVRDEGARTVYEGTIARELLALVAERDGVLTAADLEGYEAAWADAGRGRLRGTTRVHARRALRRPRDPRAARSGGRLRMRCSRRSRPTDTRRAHHEPDRRRRATATPACSPRASVSAPATSSPASTCT